MSDLAAKILAIIDPPEHMGRNGVMVLDDIYYNLEGALAYLRHEGADKVCTRTIEKVQEKIERVRELCEKENVRPEKT